MVKSFNPDLSIAW